MQIKYLIINILFVCFFIGCIPHKELGKNAAPLKQKSYLEIAKEKYGENVESILNSDKTYVLCMIKNPESNLIPNQVVQFFVYNKKGGEIIFEDKIANARVSWYNNTQLLITIQKGYVTGPTDTGKWSYIIDIKTGNKIYQSNSK